MKKTLSIILAILMIVVCMPFAFAADEQTNTAVELEYVDSGAIYDDEEVDVFYYGENEGPDKYFDGDSQTKSCIVIIGWLPFNDMCDYYYVTAKTKDGSAVSIDGYQFVTGNDAPQRDPVEWKIYGSNDNENWTLIDYQVDAVITEERNAAVDFQLENASEKYEYFRFEFHDIRVNVVPEFQLSEIAVFEAVEEPAQELLCENCGIIHETKLEEYICIVIRLVKVIVSVIDYVF